MTADVKYVAQLSRVREVTLLGAANLKYWQDRLRPFGLIPTAVDGRAELLIIGAAARFKGIPFRDVSVSVAVDYEPAVHDFAAGVCLLQAFNSSRFFAFCERAIFDTPYRHARCRIAIEPPVGLQVVSRGETLLAARRGDQTNAATPASDGGWHAPVSLLPPPDTGPSEKYFVARVSGPTLTFPFDPERDEFHLAEPAPGWPLLGQLRVSQFQPRQWIVRNGCQHAKSKTYRAIRPEGGASPAFASTG